MQEVKASSLGELTKEIEELEEERNLRKSEWEKNPCKGNEDSYYFSEMNLNEVLVKKTNIMLKNYNKKLDFSLRNLFNYSIARIRGSKKLMDEAENDLEKYSNELKNFQKKFYSAFKSNERQSIDSKV